MGPRVHFTSVIGGADMSLLPHLVDHYRGLGVESFRIVRRIDSTADPAYAESLEYARQAGITFFHTHIGKWSIELQQRLIRYAMDEDLDGWYVVADCDEFHVYDRPILDLIQLCDRDGYDFVGGCFLDRIGVDGGFPPLGPGRLWERYPLAGSISAGLLKALPLKVTLTRAAVDLLPGQHGAPESRRLPHARSCTQVHHFKWTASVIARVTGRIEELSANGQRASQPAIVRENRRFLSHIRRHGGRVNVRDPRFRLHPSGGRFHDYPYWTEAVGEAEGWQWGLT